VVCRCICGRVTTIRETSWRLQKRCRHCTLKKLTDRQRQVLSVIDRLGHVPTHRALCAELKIKNGNAIDHLRALEQKGYLLRGDEGWVRTDKEVELEL